MTWAAIFVPVGAILAIASCGIAASHSVGVDRASGTDTATATGSEARPPPDDKTATATSSTGLVGAWISHPACAEAVAAGAPALCNYVVMVFDDRGRYGLFDFAGTTTAPAKIIAPASAFPQG